MLVLLDGVAAACWLMLWRPTASAALNCFDAVPGRFDPHDQRQKAYHSCLMGVRLIGGIMSIAITTSHIQREPELLGQTVVVIGESAGIGLETARRASAERAKLILTGRSPEPLQRAAKNRNS
jgi:hypothetical protein